MLAYKESQAGQILHEGINEAGSTATFTAVGTAYSTHDEPMILLTSSIRCSGSSGPVTVWAAADQMTRFRYRRDCRADHTDWRGAAARRRPFTAPGVQQPGCRDYDPAFAYELAHIVDSGLARMYREGSRTSSTSRSTTSRSTNPQHLTTLDVDAPLRGIYRYSPRLSWLARDGQHPGVGRDDARCLARAGDALLQTGASRRRCTR